MKLILLALVFVQSGCGDLIPQGNFSQGILNKFDGPAEILQYGYNGRGRFIYSQPVPSMNHKPLIHLRANFHPQQIHSQLTLFSFFNGFPMTDGLQVRLERSENDLIVKSRHFSFQFQEVLRIENQFLTSPIAEIAIEFSNNPLIIRIWTPLQSDSLNRAIYLEDLRDSNITAVVESNQLHTQAKGFLIGVELSQIYLTHFQVGFRPEAPLQ